MVKLLVTVMLAVGCYAALLAVVCVVGGGGTPDDDEAGSGPSDFYDWCPTCGRITGQVSATFRLLGPDGGQREGQLCLGHGWYAYDPHEIPV